MHALYVVPPKINGKTHSLPRSGPVAVIQRANVGFVVIAGFMVASVVEGGIVVGFVG